MPEKFFPMKGTAYDDTDWRNYFRAIFTNGVILSDDNLAVTAGTGMNVVLGTGSAFVDGCLYTNTTPKTFTIDPADAVLNRIDRIVIRKSVAENTTLAYVLKGTPGVSAVPPEVTQIKDGTYELARVDIAVNASASSIITANIASNLEDEELCGISTARIELNIEGITAQYVAQLALMESELAAVVAGGLPGHGSMHEVGGTDELNYVSFDEQTDKTDEQKAQARENMNAAQLVDGHFDPYESAIPSVSYSGDHTLGLSDIGKELRINNGILTIPSYSVLDFPIGSWFIVTRWAGDVSIASTLPTTVFSPGDRFKISEDYASVIVDHYASTSWRVRGATSL